MQKSRRKKTTLEGEKMSQERKQKYIDTEDTDTLRVTEYFNMKVPNSPTSEPSKPCKNI